MIISVKTKSERRMKMKYEAPEMNIIEISANDVITASGITGGGATGNTGGGGTLED